MRRPFFLPQDALYLMGRPHASLYIGLANGRLSRLLQSLLHDACTYEKQLMSFPAVLCEPLDRLYVQRRAAVSLGDELLQDLMFAYSWREANWGAWLAALNPRRSYATYLNQARHRYSHGTDIIDLAIASCLSVPSPATLSECAEMLSDLRRRLEHLAVAAFPMRRSPTQAEDFIMRLERVRIARAYRRGGVYAAKSVIKSSLTEYYYSEATVLEKCWVSTRL